MVRRILDPEEMEAIRRAMGGESTTPPANASGRSILDPEEMEAIKRAMGEADSESAYALASEPKAEPTPEQLAAARQAWHKFYTTVPKADLEFKLLGGFSFGVREFELMAKKGVDLKERIAVIKELKAHPPQDRATITEYRDNRPAIEALLKNNPFLQGLTYQMLLETASNYSEDSKEEQVAIREAIQGVTRAKEADEAPVEPPPQPLAAKPLQPKKPLPVAEADLDWAKALLEATRTGDAVGAARIADERAPVAEPEAKVMVGEQLDAGEEEREVEIPQISDEQRKSEIRTVIQLWLYDKKNTLLKDYIKVDVLAGEIRRTLNILLLDDELDKLIKDKILKKKFARDQVKWGGDEATERIKKLDENLNAEIKEKFGDSLVGVIKIYKAARANSAIAMAAILAYRLDNLANFYLIYEDFVTKHYADSNTRIFLRGFDIRTDEFIKALPSRIDYKKAMGLVKLMPTFDQHGMSAEYLWEEYCHYLAGTANATPDLAASTRVAIVKLLSEPQTPPIPGAAIEYVAKDLGIELPGQANEEPADDLRDRETAVLATAGAAFEPRVFAWPDDEKTPPAEVLAKPELSDDEKLIIDIFIIKQYKEDKNLSYALLKLYLTTEKYIATAEIVLNKKSWVDYLKLAGVDINELSALLPTKDDYINLQALKLAGDTKNPTDELFVRQMIIFISARGAGDAKPIIDFIKTNRAQLTEKLIRVALFIIKEAQGK